MPGDKKRAGSSNLKSSKESKKVLPILPSAKRWSRMAEYGFIEMNKRSSSMVTSANETPLWRCSLALSGPKSTSRSSRCLQSHDLCTHPCSLSVEFQENQLLSNPNSPLQAERQSASMPCGTTKKGRHKQPWPSIGSAKQGPKNRCSGIGYSPVARSTKIQKLGTRPTWATEVNC